jgi:hypothetical protein
MAFKSNHINQVPQNHRKSYGREESDFQNYHIIRCKCLVFNQNSIRHTKKQKNIFYSKEKDNRNHSREKPSLLDKDFKAGRVAQVARPPA